MILVWLGAGLWAYAYAGYPVLLAVLPRRRANASGRVPRPDAELPLVSITVPVYNEEASIAETLNRILAADYPRARVQVLVVSDGSTDGTDDIVRSYAGQGVDLLRVDERRGKNAAENAARRLLRGDVIVNTDASVRVHPAAIRHLVAALDDPDVGVASARDVSVGGAAAASNAGETAYVGYEMWVRDLETRAGGIVGASGCLYAIRAPLHAFAVPEVLSRDFTAALVARREGYRAVSVRDALCIVPRGASLGREYERKVRTMTRGIATLIHNRDLLDPVRHGGFAWMLLSHKLCRWLLPWASLAMVAGFVLEARTSWLARIGLALVCASLAAFAAGRLWPAGRRMPRILALAAYGATSVVAGLHAWIRLFSGRNSARWEPTRRAPVA
jgi:cellulose synthase/poly-beta-1,6-N-acetylglucosamine synthase-like glycosyltransferase